MNAVKVLALIAVVLGAVGLIGWYIVSEMDAYCRSPEGQYDDGCAGRR
jgi:hypothetical protein